MVSGRMLSLVALSTLALAPVAAFAQFGPMEQDVQSTIEVYAELTLDQTTVDLGTISDETPQNIKVGFKNSGTGVLKITQVKGSCGCTVPALEKQEYKPGEVGTIAVTFNPHGKRGQQHTTVTITCDDRFSPTKTINILSNVRPNVMWDPQVVAFNQVKKGQGGKQVLTITTRIPDFSITDITSTNPDAFSAKVLETKAQKNDDGTDGSSTTIEVTLNDKTPVGMAQANLTMRTNNGKNPLINVSTFAEVTGDLQVTPVKFFLNQLKSEQDLSSGVSNKVVIKHRDGKAFKITKAEVVRLPNGLEHSFTVEVKADNDAGTSYTVSLLGKVPSSTVAAPVQGDVVLTTDIPNEETVKIGYFGMIAPEQPAKGVDGSAQSFKVDPRGGPSAEKQGASVVKKGS